MYFDFAALPKYLPYFLPAAWMTLKVSVLGIALGVVLGLGTAFMRISKRRLLSIPARAYIYVVRGTPLLLQLLFIYFGLRSLAGLSALTSAVLALGIHNGAYIAEIFRGPSSPSRAVRWRRPAAWACPIPGPWCASSCPRP